MKLPISILVYTCFFAFPIHSINIGAISHITGGIRMLFVSLKDMWELVTDKIDGPIPFNHVNKHRALMEKIHGLAERIEEVKETVHVEQLANVARILHHMTKRIKAELRMNDLIQHIHKIHSQYKQLLAYTKYKNDIENSTLRNFADNVVSHSSNSVRSLLHAIHQFIVSDIEPHSNLINLMSDMDLDVTSICIAKQSPNQLLYNLYNTIALTEMKGYAMIQFSYMLLRLYGKGNYTKESELEREQFIERSLATSNKMREAMRNASRELWRCDPDNHVEGQTYLEITQLLQGYLQNEVDLNPEGNCWENCAAYQYTKSHSCYQNLYCRQQRRCLGKILNCKYVKSDMSVCPSNQTMKRRYEYVEYENGQIYGKKGTCPKGRVEVESWWRWLFWHCSYCMCLCDEEGIFSDRYFSMKQSLADIKNNRVITGVRFAKANRIIHLQIEQGQLLPEGLINSSTIEWVPVDNYRLNDRHVQKDQTYFTLSWDSRAIDLDILQANAGYLLTGVRFQKIGSHLNLQIFVTPFNYTTGQLIPDLSEWIDNTNTEFSTHSKRTRIEVKDTDIPTRSNNPGEVKSRHNEFLEFTHTSFEKDAAQTTVPFLDSQPITASGYPNSGAGIYYKTSSNQNGGYVGIKLVTFDYSDHLMKKEDLLEEPEIN